jgi:hypothetical protein
VSRVTPAIWDELERIRVAVGANEREWLDMPISEVLSRLHGRRPYASRKWTRGELVRIVKDGEVDAALEICQYLTERGPYVIAWSDNSDPEREREAALDLDLAEDLAEIAGEEKANAST